MSEVAETLETNESLGGASPTRWWRNEVLLIAGVALIATAAGLLLMWILGVVGCDMPAHAYKTELMRTGHSIFWDNLWYGGVYGPISYGLIYYWVTVFVPAVVVTLIASTALPVCLLLYLRAMGNKRARAAAITLALVMGIYVTHGQNPFLLAMAFAMAGMALVAAGRPVLAALPFAAAIFTNPLAIVVAAPFLLAGFVARRDQRRSLLVFAACLAPFILVEGALMFLFSQPTWYVANFSVLLKVLIFCAAGLVFALLSRAFGARFWRTYFMVYAVMCLAAFALTGLALGDNVARAFQLLGIALLVAVDGVRLPRWVILPVIALAGFVQLANPASNFLHTEWYAANNKAFWTPPLAALARLDDGQHRLHVVTTKKHSEAYFVPLAGVAMTRGWFRQADAVHNKLFTHSFGAKDAHEYIAWLRSMGVEYVLWPHVALDYSSQAEPGILASSNMFTVVAQGPKWTIYRLRGAQALVTPLTASASGVAAKVTAFDNDQVVLDLPRPGAYEVRFSWSPYWRVSQGRAQVTRAKDDFIVVHASAAGRVVLRHTVTFKTITERLSSLL